MQKPTVPKLIMIVLILVVLGNISRGQDVIKQKGHTARPKLVKTQGTNEYANVHCGVRDKNGNLWFGTTGEGVYRYDGRNFTNFTKKDGLPDNNIYTILEDRMGNIWFGTSVGACRYDGRAFTKIPVSSVNNSDLYSFSSESNKPSSKNEVWSILQDKKGSFWFGTTDGVYCYDGLRFTRFLDDKRIVNKNGLHLKMVGAMEEDKKGNIWFGSSASEGVCVFDGRSLSSLTPNVHNTPHGYVRVTSILEDKEGNLWFGAGSGAYRYDGKLLTNVTKEAGLNIWAYAVVQDRSGNLWFATENGSGEMGEDGGVFRFDGKRFTKLTTKDGLIHNGVFCIVEDKVGNLWFGTRNTGLCRYDGRSFTSFSE